MKRHALLVGYTASDTDSEETLDGVLLDLENYKNYLKSLKGGAWYDNEITILNNTTKLNLDLQISILKAKDIDFVFSVFTGHGGFDKNHQCRRFLINKDETYLEKNILGISKKQIFIYDSCSNIIKESIQNKRVINSLLETASDYRRKLARDKYEEYCNSCEPQRVRLYASKVGYSAEDKNGGIYTNALIETLNNSNGYMSIVKAHDEASKLVFARTESGDGDGQITERQVTRTSKFLPGAINV